MKKLFLLAALAASFAAPAAVAGDCPGGCGGGVFVGPRAGKYTRFTGWLGGAANPKPAVAPWYVYWPYNGQIMTPGPIGPIGPGGPPAMGGLVNPYFPH
jgi:hypothetical protein